MNRDIKNPNAFPYSGVGDDTNYSKGMTLRDYFAAHAMQAMLSNTEFLVRVIADQDVGDNPKERVSNVAFAYADEMMKAREQ